jgi:hypothetical protein
MNDYHSGTHVAIRSNTCISQCPPGFPINRPLVCLEECSSTTQLSFRWYADKSTILFVNLVVFSHLDDYLNCIMKDVGISVSVVVVVLGTFFVTAIRLNRAQQLHERSPYLV